MVIGLAPKEMCLGLGSRRWVRVLPGGPGTSYDILGRRVLDRSATARSSFEKLVLLSMCNLGWGTDRFGHEKLR